MSTQPIVLSIGGMGCAGCVATVEKALLAAPGVTRVVVDLPTGHATVEGGETAALVAAVEAAGYTAKPV